MADLKARLGVDIGGTFTDLVLEVDGTAHSTKVLTTHTAPEEGILTGLQQVCAAAGVAPSALEQVIHGTTLATNALIEREGAKTALITTAGFRDVIEMRTESRFEQYDLNLVQPAPLLPREQRYVLPERTAANGDVLLSLDVAATRMLAEQLAAEGYESVAVGFLHAYANPSHELAVANILAEVMPEAMVSLSSEVSPQMREYERFNTTVANAYIKPMMKRYLGRLSARLAELGVTCPVFLMHSGGGVIALEDAAEFPVRLVESGPAGGAVFAAHIAARHGVDKALSFDMGGTTAKICLIRNQTPKTARVFEVARSYRFKKGSGMPISIPVIDMVEIGAGGGSLAHVDGMAQIRVGPKSAGSEPGPACYGRGGKGAAVTDADLVLGKLDPEHFAGGAFKLHPEASKAALADTIGDRLGMDATQAAFGVCEVVDENMANAARMHAVENGEDLSGYTMIAFGGAAPLHAGRLCEKLGIDNLLVPPGAGVGSAIGFLRAPFSFEATRTDVMRLSGFDRVGAQALIGELEREAADFVRACGVTGEMQTEVTLHMRYAGQGSEIPVALPPDVARGLTSDNVKALFETAYTSLFGRPVDGMEVEITVWAVRVASNAEPVTPSDAVTESSTTATRQRDLFDPALAQSVEAGAMSRAELAPGSVLAGPALITEDETTIIVPASREAVMQADGCVLVRPRSQEAQP